MPVEDKARSLKRTGSRKGRPSGKVAVAPAKNAGAATAIPQPQPGLADILDLKDLKDLQKALAEAFGVASVILDPGGKAVTDYVGFAGILNTVARSDGLTFLTCMEPSLITGSMESTEPVIEQCPRCGLLYGIVPITAGSHRLANWVVGQVLDRDTNVEDLIAAADAMGVDGGAYRRALADVPRMTRENFGKVCRSISLMARQLSLLAMQNLRQARDIVAREEVEEALRTSELRYRQMFSNSPFPSLVYDIETLEIVDVNDIALKSYGYRREEFLSLTVMDLVASECVSELLDILATPSANRYSAASRHVKKDGTVIDVEVTGHLLDFPGKQYRMITVIDVTERRRTEGRLNFTQAVVDRVVDCIFWLDSNARIIYVNESACRTTGYSRDELLSMTVFDIDPGLTKEGWEWHWKEKKASGSLLTESYHRAKDGRVYPVEISGSYLVYGNQEYNCTFVRDITERRKVDQQLLLTQFTVDKAAAIILWVGEDARILYANDEACRSTGYTREEMLELVLPDIDSSFTPPAWKDHWNEVRQRGTIVFESFQKRKDGSLYPVEIKGNYMEYGGIGYICSIAFDITERKKTDELLRMTRFSVDQSAIPTFWLSMDGNALRVNKAALDSLGYTEDEMLGMNVRAWDEDFPYKAWKDHICPELKARHSMTMESRYKRKNGSKFPVELNLNYMTYGGNEYVFAFAHDISERKRADEERERLQAQLLQSQKMEAIGQLAGGVAHDFNNILTAVIGYGNLLEMEMEEEDPLRAYVEEILASSEKAVNLTQSLLAFSRKQSISLKHHEINDIISGVENLLKRLLSEDIDLKISLTSPGITVMADITQIQQVLINLATNARDAMPSGGMLSIEAGHVRPDDSFLRSQRQGGSLYAMISVSDTGSGMDQQTQARIFDPFFTTKEMGKGTGLGLSIVYGIVKQHNGFISAYSEKDVGTTFHIYLPAVEERTSEGEVKPSAAKRGYGTILLAEDNPDVRRLATSVLRKTGYSVIEAADGQQAIEAFMANRDSIDLIIIDVVMPRKNGREVVDQVRVVRPDAKVLYTSGYTEDILSDKGMDDTGFAFLAKPLSPHELLRKVEDILTTT
ncbi:MAG: Blue-light-activated protein [Syntrophorhabdus sp. PtaB.Bin047]|nr:MAG: Blue-light-activated protein [Syntrophorhabdus sp. PtaB.Bin047]